MLCLVFMESFRTFPCFHKYIINSIIILAVVLKTSFIQKKENEAASHTDVPKLQALQNTQHSGESISSAQISELSSTVDSLRKTVDFLKKKMDLLGSELDQEVQYLSFCLH